MSQGLFVRQCPVCAKLAQTHDQTGKTPCSEKCAAKTGPKKKGQVAPPPEPEPMPEPAEPETVEDLVPPS